MRIPSAAPIPIAFGFAMAFAIAFGFAMAFGFAIAFDNRLARDPHQPKASEGHEAGRSKPTTLTEGPGARTSQTAANSSKH